MAVLATDNFNRANANPIGNPWTSAGDSTDFKILSNAVTPANLNGDCSAFENTVTWPNDQYSQVQVTTTGTKGSDIGFGPLVRGATGKNYYRLIIDAASSSNVALSKKINGTYTNLWTRTNAFTSGDTIYLEMQGSTLIAKSNGTAIGASATDTSLTTGKSGIAYSSDETNGSIDNWEGGDFAAAFAGDDSDAIWYVSKAA